MSGLPVAASRSHTTTRTMGESIVTRVRRAVVMTGWLALLLGGLIGLLRARPDLTETRLGIDLSPMITGLIGMVLAGLLIGAFAGLWLWGSMGLLRFAVALFAVVVGVITSDLVEGLIRHRSLYDALAIPPDAVEAAMITGGALSALVGIRTGRAKAGEMATILPTPAPARAQTRPRREQGASNPQRRTRAENGTERVSPPPRRPVRAPRRQPAESVSRASRPVAEPEVRRIELSPRALSIPKASKKNGRLRRPRNVHLGKTISSMCPYCLEEVTKNDPRGRVVCDICGTSHHADCWAITGKCEVPHLQM